MKILITGADGQLGSELVKIIKCGKSEIGYISDEIKSSDIMVTNAHELDITDFSKVSKKMNELAPDIIINCAAMTNVDGCEENSDVAFKVNSIGPRNLAICSNKIGAKLVHVSTDYVFNGKLYDEKGAIRKPFAEYDKTEPYTVYGKSKLLGEKYVSEFANKYFIFRTAWLYGYMGSNFVYTMLRLGESKDSISVVNDQIGNPTSANDLAYHILKVIGGNDYGVYHCTGQGECSWYEFACEIMKISGLKCKVNPCTSKEYNSIAKRPEYSSLDNMMLRSIGMDEMRHWKEALVEFITNINK